MNVENDQLRRFVGWLSGDVPELHNVEVPRLAESLERFLAADATVPPSPSAALHELEQLPTPDAISNWVSDYGNRRQNDQDCYDVRQQIVAAYRSAIALIDRLTNANEQIESDLAAANQHITVMHDSEARGLKVHEAQCAEIFKLNSEIAALQARPVDAEAREQKPPVGALRLNQIADELQRHLRARGVEGKISGDVTGARGVVAAIPDSWPIGATVVVTRKAEEGGK